jgi:uncharacterized protein (DUF1501 family)
MKRRTFLQTSSTVTLPVLLNGMSVSAFTSSPLFNMIDGDSDKVLVLVQLNGGNDGLNTLIPQDQYSKLFQVRQNIIVPENTLLPIDNDAAFHPSMSGFKNLYDDDKLCIVQSAGYPNQNRSHFRSTDIWKTGSEANEYLSTGWFGRYLDTQFPDYPMDYPNEDYPAPFAITIGYVVSETCQGIATNFSLTLVDPNNLFPLAEGEEGDVPDTCYGKELTFIRESIKQTNQYSETISNAAELGNNLSNKYDDNSSIARQLKVVAQMISGGLQTKIYVVSIGGFDTHANQVQNGDTTQGNHANLLSQLSQAICAFQEDLELMGVDDKVVGMTFSEFGRRIRSNQSLGTDHGTAAPLFLFGSCVNPSIFGDNPFISTDVDNQEGVAMQYDFRSIYGSVLMDLFGAEEGDVRGLLYEGFQYIPMLTNCRTTSSVDDPLQDQIDLSNYPNPFGNYTTIVFDSIGEKARISIFDVRGFEIKVVSDRKFPVGVHEIRVPTHDLIPGNYYLRVVTEKRQKTRLMVKV